MFKLAWALWKFRQLRDRPPVVISHEELLIFQKCFLSLYKKSYNEPIDPVFIYHYQLLSFFQKDWKDLLDYISQNSNETISVSN